jgi:lysyl-tRNA synthetase class 2
MSQEAKERFLIRSKIITEIRSILDKENFLEVETPALQPIPGGASALPFVTHHNTLDVDMYLRISDELYLKRLLVAGLPKVYEIGRDFRNEGIDTTHNPEFTMLEYYEAYSNAEHQMEFVEKIIKALNKKIVGRKGLTYQDKKIDMNKKFKRVKFYDLLKKEALIKNPEEIQRDDLALKAQQLGIRVEGSDSREKIMDNIFKKVCRPKIIEPTFVVEFPVDYLPLAKKCEGSDKTVDAFQLIIGGLELVKAFSELNDPLDQRKRFEAQEGFKKKGEDDAQPLDEDFITALEYGMPPAGGVGIGIDRLTMLFTDTKNIREVIIFPTLRPKDL